MKNSGIAIGVIALGGIGFYLYNRNAVTQSDEIICNDNLCAGVVQMEDCCCNITNDPSTWPTGDRFFLVAHAIGFAEGAHHAGSNPDLCNNPGDISDGASQFGFQQHSGSKVTTFPNKATGWKWLHDKIANAYNGKSYSYSADDTWQQIAHKWAGNWQPWLANVTNTLGVSPDSTLRQYIES